MKNRRVGRLYSEVGLRVLEALELANRRHGRPVTVAEVVECLDASEASRFATQSLTAADRAAKFLKPMVRRGRIYSKGGGYRVYYASPSVIPLVNASLPPTSRRSRVLSLVKRLVLEHGIAVRCSDLLEHGSPEELLGMNLQYINRALASLAFTGEIKVAGVSRGKMSNLYVPAELDPARYSFPKSTAILDRVVDAFKSVWADRLASALIARSLPRPPTTRDIHERCEQMFGPTSSRRLVIALGSMGNRADSGLRCVRRKPGEPLLWAPSDVMNHEMELRGVYASDSERVAEAVRRAIARLKRPVTAAEMEQEIAADHALRPTGVQNLRPMLSAVASRSARHRSGRSHVHRVDRIGKVATYWVGDREEGLAYAMFQRLMRDWRRSKSHRRAEDIDGCHLDSVALGRLLTMREFVRGKRRELDGLIAIGLPSSGLGEDVMTLRQEVLAAEANLTRRIEDHPFVMRDLPESVETTIPGWSAPELWVALAKFWSDGRVAVKNRSLLGGTHIAKRVDPVAPDSGPHRGPHRINFVYDCTDALLYGALHWGGRECTIQASLCIWELGRLRDRRFVLPELRSTDAGKRLAAVACCAFLQSEEGTACLGRLAVSDPDPGVRRAALWAYGFSGGERAIELLLQSHSSGDRKMDRDAMNDAIAGSVNWCLL